MLTALQASEDALDPQEKAFVSKIREHGWFATHVLAEAHSPGFSYTTGFSVNLGQSEVIVFGLRSETAHSVLWDIFRDLKAGKLLPLRARLTDVLGNRDTYLFPVDKAQYPEYLGWSRWFYGGDDFPCSQLVWPDREDRFPWDAQFDPSLAGVQPNIADGGWQPML